MLVGFHFHKLLSRIIVHFHEWSQSPKVRSVSCLCAFTFNFLCAFEWIKNFKQMCFQTRTLHSFFYCKRFKKKNNEKNLGCPLSKIIIFASCWAGFLFILMGDPQSPKVISMSCWGAFTFNFASVHSSDLRILNRCGLKLEIGIPSFTVEDHHFVGFHFHQRLSRIIVHFGGWPPIVKGYISVLLRCFYL